jgi:tetratricopeptide (TPR) repeat protein
MHIERNRRSLRCRSHQNLAATAILTSFAVARAIAQTPCAGPANLQSQVRDHPSIDAYAALGTWFGQNRQFDCANKAFRSALALDPRSARLNYFLAVSLYSSGQLEPAAAALRQSIESSPGALQPRVLLAEVLTRQGNKDAAEEQWKAVLGIDPASVDALDGLANLWTDRGDSLAAIELLRRAARNEDLTIDLARAYGVSGMMEEAVATAKQGLADDPSSLRLVNALVTLYVHQNRFEEAASLMRTYVQGHPGNFEAEVGLLRALVLNNNADEARPLGQKLLASSPHDFDVLSLNGVLDRQAGDYPAARRHLLEAVKLQPGDYTTRYNLGAALAHLNDPAEARKQLQKAIELDPGRPEAHFQLASVLRALGQTAAAQEQLTIYGKLSKEASDRAEANSKARMAAQKLEAGDATAAVSLYRQAVAATPANPMLNYRLAMALDRAGDPTEEKAALLQAVHADPTFALAQNQLGYLLAAEGSQATAEEHFRAAVKAAPGFAEAWTNLASTLGAEARYAEAQQAIATALRLEPSNDQALQISRQLAAAAPH